MPKACPHCGETSDRDNVCTWCNKSLVAEPRPAAGAGGAAKPATPPRGQPGPGQAAAAAAPAPAGGKPATVEQPRPLWPYYIGAGVTLVLVVLVAQLIAAKAAAGPPPEPADWTTRQSKTKLISIEVPGNYKFSTSGSSASYEQVTVQATKLCRVHVDGNGTKGAMGDITAAATRMTGGDSSPSVTARSEGKFHVAQGELQKKRDPSYQEDGAMDAWSFAGMPSAYSEYTAVKKVGLLGVKMRGWRISCMGGDFGYQVWAEAPQSQWERFKPTASRILESAKLSAQN